MINHSEWFTQWIIMVVKKIINFWQLNPTKPNPWMNQPMAMSGTHCFVIYRPFVTVVTFGTPVAFWYTEDMINVLFSTYNRHQSSWVLVHSVHLTFGTPVVTLFLLVHLRIIRAFWHIWIIHLHFRHIWYSRYVWYTSCVWHTRVGSVFSTLGIVL